MSDDPAADEAMGRLFAACDLDGSGFIDLKELSMICSELTPDELSQVRTAPHVLTLNTVQSAADKFDSHGKFINQDAEFDRCSKAMELSATFL